jgi:hypothetical protein
VPEERTVGTETDGNMPPTEKKRQNKNKHFRFFYLIKTYEPRKEILGFSGMLTMNIPNFVNSKLKVKVLNSLFVANLLGSGIHQAFIFIILCIYF